MNSIETVTVAPARVFKALSADDLRRCAPSIFAEHARPGVSARYTFVSTKQVVALLGAEGWEPVKASEQRVRLEDRVGFQMLLDEDSPFVATVVQDVPRIGSLAAEVLMQRIAGKEDFPSTLFTDAWLATHANGVAAAEKRWGPGVWDALGIARKDVEARWPQNGELQVVHPILP